MTANRDPKRPTVHTGGKLHRVPNQPKTPIRGFRIPDDLYLAARATAEERGEDLSTVVRACLERYVKRNRKPRKDA
jgi:hypothetical protein